MSFSTRRPLVFAADEQARAPDAVSQVPAPVAAGPTDEIAQDASRQPSAETGQAVAAAADRPPTRIEASPVTPDGETERSANRAPYWVALVASLIWVVGVAALAGSLAAQMPAGGRGAMGLILVALLAAAPLGFVWATAFAVAQARGLLAEARRARRLTDEMIGPTAMAVAQTGSVVQVMHAQIRDAADTAALASERLATLHQALASQTEQLAIAASTADRTARKLVDRLSNQRGELNTLAVTLDARAAAVTDAINRQARMVADASDLAETQLREAEASLAARAADLQAAAAEASDASRTASEDLARQVARLETAGLGVGDQLRSLEDGLTHQRAALVTVAHALRAEHEDFASLAETRTAQLSAFLEGAGRDVAALNEVTALGAQSMSELVDAAAGKFRELADAARTERDLFGASAVSSLNTLSEIGANERRALEDQARQTIRVLSSAAAEAREAADIHAEAARSRVEQLNEAAFVAGQRADQVFEARLGEARGLIAQSAKLVEEAGASTAERLEQGVAQARSALDELKRMVAEVGADVARLPSETEARAEEIRASVAKGMEDLLATARHTSEETQAIDTAFQERVKRNYEMLSEAVQLMGVVARGGQGADALRSPGRKARSIPVAETPPAVAEAPDEGQAPSAARPRLRLTSATPDDPSAEAATASPAGPPDQAEPPWTWKGLLSAVDSAGEGADTPLAQAISEDILAMGIDPAALLSRGRIEEIAAAIQTRDDTGAREVVRELAPAAVRRLSRRLIADAEFRSRCRTFQGHFAAAVNAAATHDPQGFEATSLLARDVGRAYLLVDAAIGETT